jgi:hypothetical protein
MSNEAPRPLTLAEKINNALDAGHSIQIANYLRCYRITPKTRASWTKAGFAMFKADADGTTWMAAGTTKGKPRYEIINGCKISAY